MACASWLMNLGFAGGGVLFPDFPRFEKPRGTFDRPEERAAREAYTRPETQAPAGGYDRP